MGISYVVYSPTNGGWLRTSGGDGKRKAETFFMYRPARYVPKKWGASGECELIGYVLFELMGKYSCPI